LGKASLFLHFRIASKIAKAIKNVPIRQAFRFYSQQTENTLAVSSFVIPTFNPRNPKTTP
jgi:hypothetical protein